MIPGIFSIFFFIKPAAEMLFLPRLHMNMNSLMLTAEPGFPVGDFDPITDALQMLCLFMVTGMSGKSESFSNNMLIMILPSAYRRWLFQQVRTSPSE
ncbi:MAG: hypothetical protein A3Q59_07865 [Methanomethylophilus alvi]|nr:MAG: hypothetical protein A3Q59_07865 [Methanomethylophilus alvi]